MHVNMQTSVKSNGNKGSSRAAREGFFNHTNENLTKREVIEKIDSNKKGLRNDEAKFYTVTFSPSEKEQKDLLVKITGKDINNVNELTKPEKEMFNQELQKYTRNAMDSYATNFERKKPLENGKDLVYAAKIENNRSWKGTDPEVKKGIYKSGELKPGLNTHIHVVVSRKDTSQKTKLSPLNTRRNEFDRTLYKIKAEKTWDKQTGYNRSIEDRADYQMAASKDIENSVKAEITTNPEKKVEIQQDLINNWNDKNGFTEKDKELSHEIEPSFQKEQEKEQEQAQKQNESDYEIEY